MSRVKNIIVLLLLILVCTSSLIAQKCNYRCIYVFGKTFIEKDSIGLGYVSIQILHKDTIVISETSSFNGEYELPFFETRYDNYEFRYTKKGYHTKFMRINLKDADSSEFGKYMLPLELDITLIPKNDTTNLLWGILDFLPISTAKWNDDAQTIQWNFPYTQSLLFQIPSIIKRIKKFLRQRKSWIELFEEQKKDTY